MNQQLKNNVRCSPEWLDPDKRFLEKFILKRNDLVLPYLPPLGYGAYGLVLEGRLEKNGHVKRVAVKTHSNFKSKEKIREFQTEAEIMQLDIFLVLFSMDS